MNDSEQVQQVFKHSGMATKMKGKFILDHNYIGTGKVRNEISPSRNTSDKTRFLSKEALTQRYAVAPPKNQDDDDDDFSFMESHRDAFSRFDGKSILKTANNQHHHHRHISKDSAYNLNSLSRRVHTEDNTMLTKADARKWLYPDLKEGGSGFDNKNWVSNSININFQYIIRFLVTLARQGQKLYSLLKQSEFQLDLPIIEKRDQYLFLTSLNNHKL